MLREAKSYIYTMGRGVLYIYSIIITINWDIVLISLYIYSIIITINWDIVLINLRQLRHYHVLVCFRQFKALLLVFYIQLKSPNEWGNKNFVSIFFSAGAGERVNRRLDVESYIMQFRTSGTDALLQSVAFLDRLCYCNFSRSKHFQRSFSDDQ